MSLSLSCVFSFPTENVWLEALKYRDSIVIRIFLWLIYLPPGKEVCEGYVFTGVCLCTGRGSLCPGEGSLSGRPPTVMCGLYASYWNAFLFNKSSQHVITLFFHVIGLIPRNFTYCCRQEKCVNPFPSITIDDQHLPQMLPLPLMLGVFIL